MAEVPVVNGQYPSYAVDPALAPHLDYLVEGVKQRGRFKNMDNMIEALKDEDVKNAIQDSIGYLNRMPPESSYSWGDMIYGDTRFLTMLYKVAIKLCMETLIADWTHHGYDARLEEFELPSRLPEYQALVGQLDAEIERDWSAFKKSQQLGAYGFSAGTSSGSVLTSRSFYGRLFGGATTKGFR